MFALGSGFSLDGMAFPHHLLFSVLHEQVPSSGPHPLGHSLHHSTRPQWLLWEVLPQCFLRSCSVYRAFKGLSANLPSLITPLHSIPSAPFSSDCMSVLKLLCQGLRKCHELFPARLPGYSALSSSRLPSQKFGLPLFLFLLSLTSVLDTQKLGCFYILPGPTCLLSHDFWVIRSRPERPLLSPGLCMLVYFMPPLPHLIDPSLNP